MYYAYKSRDGHVYCVYEPLDESLMCGDYLLFDTAEECVKYWREHGLEVDRYA